MTSSTVDVTLQSEHNIDIDDKLDSNDDDDDDDVVDGFDHRRCSLQLIDWKTENTATTDGIEELEDEDVHPSWKTIDSASCIVIGLTVDGSIDAVSADSIDASPLVIVLCTIESNYDGHVLTVERHLPTVIDSHQVADSLKVPCKQSGCLISVGDRDFQLGCSYYIRPLSSSSSRPPKARLQSHATNEMSAQPTSGPLVNKRLTNSMNNTELANYAASLVSSQLLMTSLAPLGSTSRDWQPPSGIQIDLLYKSFREATNVHQNVMLFQNFIAKSRYIRSDVAASSSGHDRMQSSTKCANAVVDEIGMTDHVIEVLTDLIRNTVDPLDHVVLWLELLSDFARLPVPVVADSFVRHRTTAVVLGCMTAHARCTTAQRHACHFLSRLVANWPPGRSLQQQGVKENAIELIADVVKRYYGDVKTVRAAVTSLAVVTSYLSRYVEATIETLCDSETMDEMKRQDVIRAISILDCINAVAYETVVEAAQTYGTSDREIRDQTNIVISFFTATSVSSISSSPSVSSRATSDSPRQRLRRQQSLVSSKSDVIDGNMALSSYEMVCDDLSSRDAAGGGGGISSFSRHGLGLGRRTEALSISKTDQLAQNDGRCCDPGEKELNNDKKLSIGWVSASGGVQRGHHSLDDVQPLGDDEEQLRHKEDKVDRNQDANDDIKTNKNCSKSTEADQLTGSTDSTDSSLLRVLTSDGPMVADHSSLVTCTPHVTAPSTVRRHTSLKAAVRSLLPVVSASNKLRRQQSELRPSSSRIDSRNSTSNFQPAAVAATLDVQFRRSMSVHSAGTDDVISRLSVHHGHGDLDIDSPALSTPISASATLSSRTPDVTAVERQQDGTVDQGSRLEMEPDLIQRPSQTNWPLDDKRKLPAHETIQRSPTMTSHHTGRTTLRRIVSFGSRSVWSKSEKK